MSIGVVSRNLAGFKYSCVVGDSKIDGGARRYPEISSPRVIPTHTGFNRRYINVHNTLKA